MPQSGFTNIPPSTDFEFLGLEGDFIIWVDAATDLPLAVAGKLPGVGKVRLELTAASRPLR